ncbi:hypothetical protein MCOR07_003791 [Pyricularia oryzae]|nr:hypothetical protein MCOR07_003791 [Pyricularia oryzae]
MARNGSRDLSIVLASIKSQDVRRPERRGGQDEDSGSRHYGWNFSCYQRLRQQDVLDPKDVGEPATSSSRTSSPTGPRNITYGPSISTLFTWSTPSGCQP